ncbi:3-hydroxyisobutyryl-CoA hydrolase [Paracoccidioides lutzii Pb01]|uniref:3-hydroxyisobutyryl-CoA hydrolase n=1 Tax=Paracoccidioides lutzii (strain ATCC MYA-826 / Pb01) TaxID=502779 RepID=C1GV81_PARBA|nr:3-hydroxyisobutyryl-CoA hydrolase [Paracoccidioides lutzii Pb01]EEH40499.2 3-hydroxyisobutyryl-CoA hydrolase [Paracoccidioides lutzii Pb01]
MPLRAKVTSPAWSGLSKMSTAATAAIPKELPEDEPDDVLFNSLFGVRTIELNRPKKLNALNGSMARKIVPRLKEWEKSQLANIIIISGAGLKAFCAGGDVAALAQQASEGPEGQKKSSDYFALEYRLDHLIATYSKPYISIMDGFTMGGGVGLSVHAPFRIATERTVFAMPETTIGFFPDVGGSFFLPRLDGELGTYLALTSERLSGVQTLYAGIATHYFHSSVLANLTGRLSELVFKDTASLGERLDLVNSTISEFSTGLPSLEEEPISPSGSLRESIDRCFSANTVEEIISRLQEEIINKEWAQKTLKTLASRSPTSLKVTLRQLRIGRTWSIAETFQREQKIAAKFMAHPDFVEGVTARLVNKPPTEPVWKPSELHEVTDEDVDEFFRIDPGESRMTLLNPDTDYKVYPHKRFALPSEKEIIEYARSNWRSPKAVDEFVRQCGYKDGVRAKYLEVVERKKEEVCNSK